MSLVTLLFLSCDSKSNDKELNQDKTVTREKEVTKSRKIIKKTIDKNQPIKQFQEFVSKIRKKGWYHDTLRVAKKKSYRELKENNFKNINGFPFYKVNFNDTGVKYAFDYRPYNGKYADSLDINLLKQVKNIWAYFYREDLKGNSISDGVIEQWEFKDKLKAEKGKKEIDDFSYIAYFNTAPYVCSIDKYVFIFHTRAMGYSYDQKNLFEMFYKEHIGLKQTNN